MSETTATRTLVKSPPELWAECSEASSLSRHLPGFGEITITKLDPETSVAWEGERISGTVRIEPSGWGTRVTLTAKADIVEPEPVAAEEPGPEPEPPAPVAAEVPDPEPEPVALEGEPVAPEPAPVAPEPKPAPVVIEPPVRKGGLLARLLSILRPQPALHTIPPPVTAEPEPVAVAPGPELAPEPEPAAPALAPEASEPEPEPAAEEPQPEPEPAAEEPQPEPERETEPLPSPAAELAEIEAALSAALDSLGQAHHRPFSRA